MVRIEYLIICEGEHLNSHENSKSSKPHKEQNKIDPVKTLFKMII
jgi:hypothetical protein